MCVCVCVSSQIDGLKHEMDIEVPKGYQWDGEMRVGVLRTSVFWGRVAGVPVYLIRPTDWGSCNIFKGGKIYGGSYDDREAYLYMCRYVCMLWNTHPRTHTHTQRERERGREREIHMQAQKQARMQARQRTLQTM